MKLKLEILDESKERVTKTLSEGTFRIGRSEFCDVVLSSELISRSQLELRVTEAAVYFTNMSTAGRVRLNGELKETGELKDGDELQIAPYRIVVRLNAAEEEEAPPSALQEKEEDAAPSGSSGPKEFQGFPMDGEDREPQDPPAQALESPGEGGLSDFPSDSPQNAEAGGVAEQLLERKTGQSASLSRRETEVGFKPIVAKLLFREGPRAGEDILIETFEVSFGRSKQADIFLDDKKLSRVHAKIARVGNGYRLIDLSSRNGTFVNGVRVLEHPLVSFDEIQIGSTKIQFLIQDVLIGGAQRGGPLELVGQQKALEQTRSVHVGAFDGNAALDLGPQELEAVHPTLERPQPTVIDDSALRRRRLLIGIVVGLLVVFFLIPTNEEPSSKSGTADVSSEQASSEPGAAANAISQTQLPPQIPKEYLELSAELQRGVEGHYNSSISEAQRQNYAEALDHIRRIHQYLPFYKDSLAMQERYQKKLKELQIQQAQEKAKADEQQDLQIYLQEGMEYLSQGDFERAAESFNSAVVIDPSSDIARKGLRAADMKIHDIRNVPDAVDPDIEQKKKVQELFQQALAALQTKAYQDAINRAKEVLNITIEGDQGYKTDAQSIIDRAYLLQKDEFEPFLIQAKEKYAEGDYNASRDLCEEMVKRDPSYGEASDCVLRAKKQLNRLAKEAYTHGYILESMNRIEEAKQYWNRAKNYVRDGDEYFKKINRKLDYYQ